MQTGTYISGIGHGALIGWMLFGGLFLRERAPLTVQSAEVTMITSEEFAALTAPPAAPSTSADAPAVQTPAEDAAPAAPAAPPAPATPDLPVAPGSEIAPDAAPESGAVAPLPPPLDLNPETPITPDAPTPDPGAVLAAPSATPKPKPAPRVAPKAAEAPAPDAKVAEQATPEVSPDARTPEKAEPKPAEAPPEAATEIVTEAEKPSSAPKTSPKPKSRPPRQAAVETPKPDAPPARGGGQKPTTVPKSAVDAALAEALGTPDAPSAPSGPPLTGGEKDALRVAVSACWNLGSSSTEALRTTVVVRVEMSREARPVDIRLVSSDGSSDAATRTAFDAARRAILRCGAEGYNLPADKYGQWQNIEMTFNPDKMRIK